MPEKPAHTADGIRRLIDDRGLQHIKVGVFDIDGILRGKFMSRDKFLSALDGGFGFCDVVLGWDSNDQLYDNVALTGWHTGYPDAEVQLLPETCRDVPSDFDGDGLLLLGQFTGAAADICPRNVLQRVIARAHDMGFAPVAAFEYEFFLFDETPSSAAAKGYRELQPISPGNFGYSVLRASTFAAFYEDLLATCRAMDFPLEGLHTETGPGVLEAAIAKDSGIAAADKAALFKTFAKVVAQRHGMLATFMAKWSPDYPGQSGHLHLSLRRRDSDAPVFHDAGEDAGMSATMRHFIAGQQALLPELLAMVAPTVNAFTRMVPGFWAPTGSTWGIENRTCAIRAITGGKPEACRAEYRVAAADGNPYLVMAAALASGLYGVENGLEPTAPISGNAYELRMPNRLRFPETLSDAARRLRKSATARALFGDAFVEHFAATREWEEREQRKAVTDWQLQRYFEII